MADAPDFCPCLNDERLPMDTILHHNQFTEQVINNFVLIYVARVPKR